MRVGYFECIGGISGDMILGALVDAGADLDALKSELKKLNLTGYEINEKTVEKQGHRARKITVNTSSGFLTSFGMTTNKEEERTFDDIRKLIGNSLLPDEVKTRSLAVFEELVRAEAVAHGTDIEKVHFHEVGATDALIDIVGSVVCLSSLKIDSVKYSPLPVANPAPATVEILEGTTVRGVASVIETVTPTGASLVKTLAEPSKSLPPMKVENIGCGAGEADTEIPNIVRFYVGEVSEDIASENAGKVLLVETNLDDVTAEMIGHVSGALLEGGALDVWSTAIYMKKNRPGVTLSVLCRDGDLNSLCETVFKETGTLGVRVTEPGRIELQRDTVEVDTEFGKIPMKIGLLDEQTVSVRPEYEICRTKAEGSGATLEAVMRAALIAYEKRSGR